MKVKKDRLMAEISDLKDHSLFEAYNGEGNHVIVNHYEADDHDCKCRLKRDRAYHLPAVSRFYTATDMDPNAPRDYDSIQRDLDRVCRLVAGCLKCTRNLGCLLEWLEDDDADESLELTARCSRPIGVSWTRDIQNPDHYVRSESDMILVAIYRDYTGCRLFRVASAYPI